LNYGGLEWWDEVLEDGKELRLSQMLADEEYAETMEEEDQTPMSLEQFAEETEKLIEQAEDERKETEAIMNAPPNANFLEGPDEDTEASAVEKSVSSSDKFGDMIMQLADVDDYDQGENDKISAEEILQMDEEVLQMDDLPGKVGQTSNSSSTLLDENEKVLESLEPKEKVERINGNSN